MSDKKEYNKQYFQDNKENIYYQYKRRYYIGKSLTSEQPNWYVKRKYKTQTQLLTNQSKQSFEVNKVVDSISVRFD